MPKNSYKLLADSLATKAWTCSEKSRDWETTAPHTATIEQMHTAALLDIMQSLRAILDLMRCQNVSRGLMSMQALERLAREFWVRPTKRKKKKKAVTGRM